MCLIYFILSNKCVDFSLQKTVSLGKMSKHRCMTLDKIGYVTGEGVNSRFV